VPLRRLAAVLGRRMGCQPVGTPDPDRTVLDGFGRPARIAETPVVIGIWTTWTIWTTSIYWLEKNMLCNRRLMRGLHNDDPGQPWLHSANRVRGGKSGNGRRISPSSAHGLSGA